jgi:hypothetical protein
MVIDRMVWYDGSGLGRQLKVGQHEQKLCCLLASRADQTLQE